MVDYMYMYIEDIIQKWTIFSIIPDLNLNIHVNIKLHTIRYSLDIPVK